MTWKTRGTARREAAGMKKQKEWLEFQVTHADHKAFSDKGIEHAIQGLIHKDRKCKAIKSHSHICFFHVFEDHPKRVACKIGRLAWGHVKRNKHCPHCQDTKNE